MCGPAAAAAVPYIVGAITAATSVYSVVQADRQAKSANKAAAQQQQIEEERANREAKDRQNTLQNQALEESSKFKQQRERLEIESLREQASSRVASAEGGIGGVSSIRSFIANEIGQDLARSDIAKSEGFTGFNLNQQERGIATSRQERIENSVLTQNANTRRRPTTSEFVVAGISGGLEGYSAGKGITG